MGRSRRRKQQRAEEENVRKETGTPQADSGSFLARRGAPLLLLFFLALLIYGNTFSVPFQFDDGAHIVDNPRIRSLANFLDLSGTRDVGFLTFSLNYAAGGLKVFGYHLVNLLIHIANGFLVYSLVLLLLRAANCELRASWIAIATALLFVSHPVQTQAVTYIVQRFASLMTLFYLLAVVGYLKWRTKGKLYWYIISLLSTVLAMKTKENGFTIPFMILLADAVFFRPFTGRRWLTLIPFLLTLPIIPISHGDAIGEAEGFARDFASLSRSEYLFTQFRVIITYLRLLILPVHQSLDYDYPIYRSLFHPAVFLSFLFLSSLVVLAVYLLRRSNRQTSPFNPELRIIAFGILWFFLTLSVESSIIPIRDVIFEHRLYLPSAGVFLAAMTWLLSKGGRRAAVAVGVVVLALGLATHQRNKVWRDEFSLWQDVVRKTPHKARGHQGLGFVYRDQGRLEEAVQEYQIALRIQPNYVEAHNGLGVAYQDQGRFEEAIREYQAALNLQPNYAKAHTNLGATYKSQGRLEEAIREYEAALQIQPDYIEAVNGLGVVYQDQGRFEEAIQEYQAALRLQPDYAKARMNLGTVYQNQGRVDEATREYQTALTLQPDKSKAHNNLASALVTQGRIEEAIREYQVALSLEPGSAEVRYGLGIAFAKQGRLEEAIREYQAALELKPDYAKTRLNLGTIYAMQGRVREAIREYEIALKLQPDSAEARNNLGNVYLSQGRFQEAALQYREALRLKPDFAEARNNLDHAMGR